MGRKRPPPLAPPPLREGGELSLGWVAVRLGPYRILGPCREKPAQSRTEAPLPHATCPGEPGWGRGRGRGPFRPSPIASSAVLPRFASGPPCAGRRGSAFRG